MIRFIQFLIVLMSINFYSQTTIVSSMSNWKYLDDGSDQGAAWYGTGFDDVLWVSGAAELGYGETQTTTVSYGLDPANKYPTTYFRKSFEVSDASVYTDLKLEVLRDDGVVVYLNGIEVWSNNMPASFDYQTFAVSAIDGSEESVWVSRIINNSLVTGTNVLAVEIHQRSASSSDLSFDFKLTGYSTEIPISITRGPYLQTGTSTSTIIKWRTNKTTESIIKYGTSLGALNSTNQDNTQTYYHEITLTGLLPNTKYFYEIADLDGVYVAENINMYVQTSPNIGEIQFVRAWILGDAGTANQDQKDVRDQYYNYVSTASTKPNQTDMMLFLGDNAYDDGTDYEYQIALFDIYPDMLKKSVAWSTLGNHDGYSAKSSTQSGIYYDIFSFPKSAEAGGTASGTEAYYSFDYANIHFIVLESYKLYDDATQKAWCEADIQATSQDWIVALFHHPPYSKGSHDSDSSTQLIAMRENFLPILEDNGVDLVLCGHSHSYERSYFINGHYGLSTTFSSITNTVGSNGYLSGKADNADGAYEKSESETKGAVYITTGSAGKISGGALDHNAMFVSLNQLGSCVLEIENNVASTQNLNVKFLNNSGGIDDYFSITKSGILLSTDENEIISSTINVYPVPADSVINIDINTNAILQKVKFYSITGALIKESNELKIDVSAIPSGYYMIEIETNKAKIYKRIIIE